MPLSDEQMQEFARQAAFCSMGDVREVLDRVVAETAEACAKRCDDADLLNALCGMVSQSFTSGEWYIAETLRGETFKEAIRAAAKEGK